MVNRGSRILLQCVDECQIQMAARVVRIEFDGLQQVVNGFRQLAL